MSKNKVEVIIPEGGPLIKESEVVNLAKVKRKFYLASPRDGEVSDIKPFISENKELIPGAGFTARSEIWDLSSRETVAKGTVPLYFDDFPQWIKPFIQDFIAYKLVVLKRGNGTLYQNFLDLRSFSKFLKEMRPDICNIGELDFSIAKSFLKWFGGKTDAEVSRVGCQSTLKQFSAFLYRMYAEKMHSNFNVPSLYSYSSTSVKSYAFYQDKATPTEVVTQVMKALKQEEEELREFLNTVESNNANQKTNAINKLIYCQALKIIIASGRRSSHSLLIDREPLVEPTYEEADGVWLRWNETKTKQGYQEVFINSPLDEIVREAVKKAQGLTKDYVELANDKDQEKLFLMLGYYPEGGVYAHPIRYYSLNRWINGHKSRGKHRPGFMERHNIQHEGGIFRLKLHGLRHARFTHMRLGGAGIGTVQNDAKHVTSNMSKVYINGDAVAAKDFENAVENRDLMGYLKDFVYNKELRFDKISPAELKRYRENGMFVQFTEFGYCHLEIEKGTCPVGTSCWLGKDGCGCEYHLTTPEFLPAIKEDLEVMLEDYEDVLSESPNSPIIGHYQALIGRFEQIVEEAELIKGRVNNG